MTHSEIPWLRKFQEHPKYKGKRLKTLPKIHNYLRLDNAKGIDIVDKATFAKYEADRIPLFMGTSMGIGPGETSIDFDRDKEIAIVAKSPLSGMTPSMRIYRVKEGDDKIRILEERQGERVINKM